MDNHDGFCCEEMRHHLHEGELHLVYEPKFRDYGIEYNDGGTSFQSIAFCPWCGTKLPSSLRTEWFEELDRLGMEPEDEQLPDRLKTDAWWRNPAQQ